MAAGDFQVPLISPAEFAKEKVKALQDYALLTGQSLANLFRRPLYVTDMIQQADLIGVGSLPIVILTGGFTGAVLALNSASTLSRFGSLTLIAQLVSVGMVTELGPVITGLMVAGRNSSGMASELGSMTVTEQIDAMRALGTDPTKKLVTPRVVSTVVMLFFLTIISDLLGLVGGNMVSSLLLGLDSRQYWTSAWQSLVWRDLTSGPDQAGPFRFCDLDRGLLFRHVDPRRHARCGTLHDPGRRRASVMILVTDFFVTSCSSLCWGTDRRMSAPTLPLDLPAPAAKQQPAAKPSASRM